MNILITGGCGFIGSHLVELLLADASTGLVVSVDPCSGGPFPEPWPALADPRFSWLQQSFEDFLTYRAPSGNFLTRFDRVYHLASAVGPLSVMGRTHLAAEMLAQTAAVARYAKQHGARMVFASSSEVYGRYDLAGPGRFQEDGPTLVVEEPSLRLEYSVAKRLAEIMLRNDAELDVAVVRVFNAVGQRQRGAGGFVLPRFVGQALAGLPITVYGDGSQVRAFTHVRDVVRGFHAAAELAPRGQVYNLANPDNGCSILQLAGRVSELVGGEILLTDPRRLHGEAFADTPDRFPIVAKAAEHLDWTPQVALDDAILEVGAWLRSLPEPERRAAAGI